MDEVILEVDEVCKSFGGIRAVCDLTFGIPEGKIVALIGPNGAGKTTLINVISGLYSPDAGEVRFRGQNITGLKSHLITRRGIARTFQLVRVFSEMTVLENVMVGRHLRTKVELADTLFRWRACASEEECSRVEVMKWLALVGLSDRASAEATGLTFADQRLLEMARALATEPALLLVDEPAAGLNQVEAHRLCGTLRRIQGLGVTILLVEHNMQLVMNVADSIVVMNYGKKLAEGPPSTIRSNEDVIRAYLGDAYRVSS